MGENRYVLWMADAIGENQKTVVLSNVPDEEVKKIASKLVRNYFDESNQSYRYNNVTIFKVSEEIHFEEDELNQIYG